MTQRVMTRPPTKEDEKQMEKYLAWKKQQEAEEAETMNVDTEEELEDKDEAKESPKPGEKRRKHPVSKRESEKQSKKRVPEKEKKPSPPAPRKSFRSPIIDAVAGKLQTETTCSECGHVSKVLNPYRHLNLPLPEKEQTKRAVEERGAEVPPAAGIFSSITNFVGLTAPSKTLDLCLHSFYTS